MGLAKICRLILSGLLNKSLYNSDITKITEWYKAKKIEGDMGDNEERSKEGMVKSRKHIFIRGEKGSLFYRKPQESRFSFFGEGVLLCF